MSSSPELGRNRNHEIGLIRQMFGLVQICRVELIALAAAVLLTAFAGKVFLVAMQNWDANSVVLLIAALWLGICGFLYRLMAPRPAKARASKAH